jgi:hypothetical protein
MVWGGHDGTREDSGSSCWGGSVATPKQRWRIVDMEPADVLHVLAREPSAGHGAASAARVRGRGMHEVEARLFVLC